MGLEAIHLRALRELPKGKLLCLGYPDLLVETSFLRDELGLAEPKAVEDPAVAKWHGWAGPVYDTDQTLRHLGFEPHYVDIKQNRGTESILDLNNPVSVDWWERFDVIADLGTAEHCFNIGRVFANIRSMLKPDGFVLHANPLSMVNHGLFNLSPGIYHDWYRLVHHHYAYWGPIAERSVANIRDKAHARLTAPNESMQIVVAQHPHEEGWPMQRKYK